MKNRSPWIPFTALLISAFVVIEAAAFQVPAMPFITEHFGISTTFAGAITICYYAAGIVFAPLAGRLGDQIGRKQMTLIGLAIFTISELMAALSPTFSIFLIARFIQGVGYACIFPTIFAFINDLFPENKRGFPIGLFAAVGSFGAAAGGIIAGLLVDAFGWTSIYWVTAVLSALGILIVTFVVPKTKSGKVQTVDYKGAIMLLITVGSIVSLPMLIGHYGVISVIPITLIITAVIGLILLIMIESRVENPILDLQVIKIRGVHLPSIIAILLTFSQISLIYALSFFIPTNSAWGAAEVGLVSTFSYGLSTVAAIVIGRLTDRYKAEYFVTGTFVLFLVTVFLFTTINSASPLWYILMIVSGIGFCTGAVQTSLMKIVITDVPSEKKGVGTGSFTMFRDLGIPLGSTFGLALFGTQQTRQTENALVENSREMGIGEDLLPAVTEAGRTNEIAPELATQLQTLGIQFDELLSISTSDGISAALSNVGFVIIGVMGILILISLLLLKKNKKVESPANVEEVKSSAGS